jgi:hypothetical protein
VYGLRDAVNMCTPGSCREPQNLYNGIKTGVMPPLVWGQAQKNLIYSAYPNVNA